MVDQPSEEHDDAVQDLARDTAKVMGGFAVAEDELRKHFPRLIVGLAIALPPSDTDAGPGGICFTLPSNRPKVSLMMGAVMFMVALSRANAAGISDEQIQRIIDIAKKHVESL